MMPALSAIGLKKRYGENIVLRDLSLAVLPGAFVAVTGPSGSGKTTLFRCLARLVEPDEGEIFIGGHPLHGLQGGALAAARREIGIVFQQFNLIRRRSAMANVLTGRLGTAPLWRVASGCFSTEDRKRAAAALDAVGLGAQSGQRADTLSGGQQQRVAIARALAQESRVLLADEPVASLDPENATAILSLMRSLAHRRSLAILCTLHQPDLAARFADEVVEMQAGRLSSRLPASSMPPKL
jgi:phosphonate transport system ATP-binding protein